MTSRLGLPRRRRWYRARPTPTASRISLRPCKRTVSGPVDKVISMAENTFLVSTSRDQQGHIRCQKDADFHRTFHAFGVQKVVVPPGCTATTEAFSFTAGMEVEYSGHLPTVHWPTDPLKLIEGLFDVKTFKEHHKAALKQLRKVPKEPDNIKAWIDKQERILDLGHDGFGYVTITIVVVLTITAVIAGVMGRRSSGGC